MTDNWCWAALESGDGETFARQAALGAELSGFAVCAGLLEEPPDG